MKARTRGAYLGAGLAAALLFPTFGMSVPARADTVQSDALFNEGQALFEQGNYAEACKKFQASLDLVERLGTLLNLARCHKFEGKTATAYAEFKKAEAMARKAGENDRAETAAGFAQELEATLSRLTVVVEAPAEGQVVMRDGAELASASYGVAIPADPGERTITATAPGKIAFETKITIGQSGDSQTVTIPPLADDPNAGAAVPGPGGDTGPGGDAGPADSDPGAGMRMAGFIVGGVGVVGLGLGAIFGIVASSTASGAEDDPTLCPEKQCTPAGREEIDSAETSALVSTIGFGVGAAALAGGVILIVLAGNQGGSESETGLRVLPTLAPGAQGVTLTGTF